jgi:hypothetical protein
LPLVAGGHALCEEEDWPCVAVTDRTGGGAVVDVTHTVAVGTPVQ